VQVKFNCREVLNKHKEFIQYLQAADNQQDRDSSIEPIYEVYDIVNSLNIVLKYLGYKLIRWG
jgi:uncharacterized UPF0160 family protein